ncbi:MAG TPA: thiamine phosphate synthase [Burkholderiales bacterium]|nr:thiamine phosphate synthase [Burkholderiales bacterium]
MNGRISGLYAITPDLADTQKLIKQVHLALKGGTRWLQYRNKSADRLLKLQQANALMRLCREFAVPLIIDDSVDIVLEINAAGVHLGAQDCSIPDARSKLGEHRIIGASCYDNLQRALKCEAEGADYVAFGSFFSSAVKPDAVRAQLKLLHEAKARLRVPVVAVGGIDLQNASLLINAGVDAVAVVSALFNAQDVMETAKKFTALFAA